MTNADRLNLVARSLLEDVDGPNTQRFAELRALHARVASDPLYLDTILAEVSDTAIRERLRVALTEPL